MSLRHALIGRCNIPVACNDQLFPVNLVTIVFLGGRTTCYRLTCKSLIPLQMKRLYCIITGWFQVQTVPECFSSSSWQSADQALLWRTQPFNIKQELFETYRKVQISSTNIVPSFDILVTTMPNHRGHWRGRIATPGCDQGLTNQLTWGEVHLNSFIQSGWSSLDKCAAKKR